MKDRFLDATPEEVNEGDTICIICREEMTTAKKLVCGHLFHVNCLRSWLERQHTCPTCRALVEPPENGTDVAGSRYAQQDPRTNSHVSQHQARLQAAAIYEKSIVYPSAQMLPCHLGANMPFGDSSWNDLSTSDTQLEAHRIFLQQQIEHS